MHGYMDLKVWQKGMTLAVEIYRITGCLPPTERFGLQAQMRRAAVSIPSNIAEGHSRRSTGDYRRHLQIARGSTAELETQLILTRELRLLTSKTSRSARSLCNELTRMLASLQQSLD